MQHSAAIFDLMDLADWKGTMHPTEWAGNKIEILARNHPLVWVEDPYALIETPEVGRLRSALNFISHSVLCIQNAFELRKELLCREPGKARLVVIDQSYTLRDPHLLPKDAKPSDLVPIPAPDWKPLVEEGALFRPTIHAFLADITDDPHWPVEVNIYPYEALARSDPDGFVRAYDSFRETGRNLTTDDLLMVGASAAFGLDLVDLSDPFLALKVAFHSEDQWRRLTELFNPGEIDEIRRRLAALPRPICDLFGSLSDTARLALTSLLVFRQHSEDPGIHLAALSTVLAPYADCAVASASEAPAWFIEDEVPRFETLVTPGFSRYLAATFKFNETGSARAFTARERYSPKLRSMALAFTDTPVGPKVVPAADEFSLGRMVPEFRAAKETVRDIVKAAKPGIERLRLTALKQQTARSVLDIFDQAGVSQIDGLSGRLERLIRDVEGPGRIEWPTTPGFEAKWAEEVRDCRNLMATAAKLEARYAEIVPQEMPTARSFYQGFMSPRRQTIEGGIRKAVVLVIDSMRFDLWRQLIRPALERDYLVNENVAFAELPSETRVSRVSFFAGQAPGAVRPNTRESDLFAELLARCHGGSPVFDDLQDRRPGLRFAVRSRDRLTMAGVFDFADALSHHIDWDPFVVQETLRPLVHEIRGLLAAEGPDTLVFITADHGHHLHEGGAPVYIEGTTDVGYRSAYVGSRIDGVNGQHVFQIPAATLGHSLPGLFVFPKPRYYLRSRDALQGAGRPSAGYRHGGLSLFEVAVPLVCLTHRAAPARVSLSVTFRGRAVAGQTAKIDVALASDGVIQSLVRLAPDTEDVGSMIVSGVTSVPAAYQLPFTPASPGRRLIRISAHLADQKVAEGVIEVDVAAPPAPEDAAKSKLRKLFGDD
jgi:hypothetical protein